jgi:hypothetical protein
MGLLQGIADFLKSIFMGSSPDVQKKQLLKKIDTDLRLYRPVLYKNGTLQPNMAEVFRLLYENTKPVTAVLSVTINSDDVQRNIRFFDQLILTGFASEKQEKLESLNYENRKKNLMSSSAAVNRVFNEQHRVLESLLKDLSSPDFVKIDQILAALNQLADICRFNFITAVRAFDPAYDGLDPEYKPLYQIVTPKILESTFLDLYYITATFAVDSALARAVVALAELHKGSALDEQEIKAISEPLKKIHTIFSKVLTPEVLKKFICLAKEDPSFTPQAASYKADIRQKFAVHLQEQFTADENRLKTEIKDKTIESELNTLFSGRPLEELQGYNAEMNRTLLASTSVSFFWITPMQVIKTFVMIFLSDQVKAVLNDIVIEGFFNNPSFKSDFSSIIYACSEIPAQIEKFESGFARNGEYDQAVLFGFIRDSHKDADFLKKLEKIVDTVNAGAKQIIQDVTSTLYDLYIQTGELLVDAKKTTPDTVSNIKVLLSSSRNRDNAELLEQQYGSWNIFLEIMKNYAIIGEIEKKT